MSTPELAERLAGDDPAERLKISAVLRVDPTSESADAGKFLPAGTPVHRGHLDGSRQPKLVPAGMVDPVHPLSGERFTCRICGHVGEDLFLYYDAYDGQDERGEPGDVPICHVCAAGPIGSQQRRD